MRKGKSNLYNVVLAVLMSAATITFTAVVNPAHPMPASMGVSHKTTPLVILRFNQRKVYYEKQLFKAVSRAVEVKPSVTFNLVAYVPQTSDPLLNQRHMSEATSHLREVSGAMMKMGIHVNKMSLSTRRQSGLKHDEVHIFVR